MKFIPLNKTLKNGETIVIREATIEDAIELTTVVKEYIQESEFIPYAKDEFNPTKEEEEKWIQTLLDTKNSLLLLATHNGKIVGNISLNGGQRIMMQHTAGIGIGLLTKWRGLGIGSLLFELAIDWAKKNPLLETLWLETYANNEIGLSVYQKFGFIEVGRHNRFFKISPKKYADNLTMTLRIK